MSKAGPYEGVTSTEASIERAMEAGGGIVEGFGEVAKNAFAEDLDIDDDALVGVRNVGGWNGHGTPRIVETAGGGRGGAFPRTRSLDAGGFPRGKPTA